VFAERDDLKKRFIQHKKECREAITGLNKKKAEARTKDLSELQAEFRLVDEEYKAYKDEETRLTVEDERGELFGSAAERKRDRDEFDPSKADNNTLLKKGSQTAKKTTDKLRDALGDIRNADEVLLLHERACASPHSLLRRCVSDWSRRCGNA
jgi:hypothetical protein